MSEFISVPGVSGTDGITPVYNPTGRWCSWALHELYLGKEGSNRYVPKVKDWVFDINNMIAYYVKSIDPVTYVPTLEQLNLSLFSGEEDEIDLILGTAIGSGRGTYRVFCDKSTIPYNLSVDRRYTVPGADAKFIKIFRGTDLTDANVISAVYDASNTLISTTVPLEVVKETGNISIKAIPTCSTKADLADNEIVYVVAYSDAGHVVRMQEMLVKNTAFIATTDRSTKYITSISLKSPFMSSSDDDVLQYPLNVPLVSMNLIGVVNYSDGTTAEIAVDGTKFQAFGFDTFVSTQAGEQFEVTLKYNLSSDEVCYEANRVSDAKFVSRIYKAQVVKWNGAYTCKLYGFPTWDTTALAYRLEWFLFNLERSKAQRVTAFVRVEDTSSPFRPDAYGSLQNLVVSLNLRDVDNSYTAYKHVQTVGIALFKPPTESGTKWTVTFDPNQKPVFGENNALTFKFINENLKKLDLSMGLSDRSEWLSRLYTYARPQVNTQTEAVAPAPNFFAVIIGSNRVEYSIDNWNQTIDAGVDLYNGGSVFIEFFKRTSTNDLHLAMAGIPAIQN
jgi:hypothetical protein